MKSTRASSKTQPLDLPYGAIAHTRRRATSLLSRVARRLGAAVATWSPLRLRKGPLAHEASSCEGRCAASTSHACPLYPGDVLRDVAFFAPSSEVAFFSTHACLCADVFGVVPGEVWEMRRESGGAAVGHVAVIVGARGGRLWAFVSGEAAARALHVPPTSSNNSEVTSVAAASASSSASTSGTELTSAGRVRAAIMAHHDAHLLAHPLRALIVAEEAAQLQRRGVLLSAKVSAEHAAEVQMAQQAELAARVRQLRVDYAALRTRAGEEALRVYTADQRAFLQRAPDLYVAAIPSVASTRVPQQPQHTQNEEADHFAGGEKQGAGAAAAVSSPFSSSPSVYAALARGDAEVGAVVLLAPRVIVATATVGWTGEDDVTLRVPQVGHDYGEGSLSASVVI